MTTTALHAKTLQLRLIRREQTDAREVSIARTIIAGWTGRDRAGMEHHIAELEAIGVARPPQTPMFYRVSCQCLTTATVVEVSGADGSGEVEFVLLAWDGDLWVGVGSDHTDRKVETYDITVSKQMCPKPLAGEFWRFSDVHRQWDQLTLRAWIGAGSARELYQEGPVSAMLAPDDLINRYTGGRGELAPGTLMFCGTLPAIGGVRAGSPFEFELVDPTLDRRITHHYRIQQLPRFE